MLFSDALVCSGVCGWSSTISNSDLLACSRFSRRSIVANAGTARKDAVEPVAQCRGPARLWAYRTAATRRPSVDALAPPLASADRKAHDGLGRRWHGRQPALRAVGDEDPEVGPLSSLGRAGLLGDQELGRGFEIFLDQHRRQAGRWDGGDIVRV